MTSTQSIDQSHGSKNKNSRWISGLATLAMGIAMTACAANTGDTPTVVTPPQGSPSTGSPAITPGNADPSAIAPTKPSAGKSGGLSNNNGGGTTTQADATAQVQKDIKDLSNVNTSSLATYDAQNNKILTKIFGGTDSRSITKYLTDRAHYYAYGNTVSVDGQKIFANMGEQYNRGILADSSSVHTIALNVGTLLWIIGEAGHQPVYFTIDGSQSTPVTVNSSRVGLVILSDAYMQLDEVTRLASVMHEGRHSDCTGGLKTSSLPAIATALQKQDSASLASLSGHCGHLHVVCPSSLGDYAGLAACDNESWGAYTVGAVFADAMAEAMPTAQYMFDKAFAVDSFSRTINKTGGDPDMTSEGLVNN